MTRINLVDPGELSDQHLMAEYREMPMVPAALRRSLRTKSVDEVLKSIPKDFTLNTGHVRFFYDKLYYLNVRYHQLVMMLSYRGYTLHWEGRLKLDGIPEVFYGDYQPTSRDFDIIRERIASKIAMKPHWYTKNKKPYLFEVLTSTEDTSFTFS